MFGSFQTYLYSPSFWSISVADDFLPLSSLRSFQPGQSDSECVSISIVDDIVPEDTEALVVALTSSDPDVTNSAFSVVSIEDNDGRIALFLSIVCLIRN